MTSTTEREHGHTKYVVEKCRCDICAKAAREYNSWIRRQDAYGIPRFVDAGPSREHIQLLAEHGIGWMRVAKLAGVSNGGVSLLLYGDAKRGRKPVKRVRRETEAKILAVKPDLDLVAPSALVDGIGTVRRLEALVVQGYTKTYLAGRVGVTRENFWKVFGKDRVRASTVRAVAELFDELWDTIPPRSTKSERINYTRAKNDAARLGYLPFFAWDDIDDPNEQPAVNDAADESVDEVLVARVIAGDAKGNALNRSEKLALAQRMLDRNATKTAIARKLGMQYRQVENLMESA